MMFLTPRKQPLSNILVNSLGAFIAGFVGSLIIILCTFFLNKYFNLIEFNESTWIAKVNPIFPFIISIITLLGTTIVSFFTYFLLNITDSEKYKKNRILFGQLGLFQIISYIIITPLYIYIGLTNFDNIMIIFIFHVILAIFGTNLILEIFNNYRYILIGFYGTIIGTLLCIIFIVLIYTSLSSGFVKMIILALLLPLINFIIILLKQLFELAYYYYYKFTSYDPLGDIFYQVELEENRKAEEEEEKNSI